MSLLEDFAKAISRAKSKTIASLLKNGSVDVNARLPRFTNPPPLVFAAECKRPAIVEQLLIAGARIDDVDDNRRTACHAAVEARSVDVLTVLLKHRPNLEIKDKFHITPLQLWLYARDDQISLMLIGAGASLDCVRQQDLCWFASTSTAAIQALLNRGVVVNQLRGDDDWTPLHFIATRNRHTDLDAVVNMLINVCGVDVDARTASDSSCMQIAVSNYDALCCFITAGADVNCLDNFGRPMLHRVCEYPGNKKKHILILLAAGADVNARDRHGHGQTAFERLVAQADPPRWLLPTFMAAGADLSALDTRAAVSAEEVEAARRDIAKERLDFVRHRALQVCIGLQSLRINALQLCEILPFACGPLARLIAFHQWWNIATAVKHFHARERERKEKRQKEAFVD